MQVTIPLSSTIAFSRLDASQTRRPHVFLLTSKEELLLSLDSFTRSTTEIDFQATYISLYLPISPYISIYLPLSPYISLYLPLSPYISLYLPISPYISLYLRSYDAARGTC